MFFMCQRVMLQLLLPLLCYSYCLILEVHVTVQHTGCLTVYLRKHLTELYKVFFFLTFKSVVETLVFDHSNESC